MVSYLIPLKSQGLPLIKQAKDWGQPLFRNGVYHRILHGSEGKASLAYVVHWRGCGSWGRQAVTGSAQLLKCRPRHPCVIRTSLPG